MAMTAEWFWSNVQRGGPHECWPWKMSVNRGGYGVVARAPYRNQRAHRVAFLLAGGVMVEPMVLHSCDNPPCCNPAHLSAGSALRNARERNERGRANPPRGEAHGSSKLTAADVAEIRAVSTAGESRRSVARRFEISISQVQRIVTSKNWARP